MCEFGQWSRFRFFHTTCRFHYFRSQNHGLGGFTPFGRCMKVWCGNGYHGASNERVRWPEPFWFLSHPTHPIHHFRSWNHGLSGFVPFGHRTKHEVETGTWVPLMSEFGGQSRFGFIRTQRVNPPLRVLESSFRWFRGIWSAHGAWCKNGYLGAANELVWLVEPFWILSHPTRLFHHFRS